MKKSPITFKTLELFTLFFLLCLSMNCRSQVSENQILLEESGMKVTGNYELVAKGGKKDEYKVTFNYQNNSGANLEYSVNKLKNSDESYRLPALGRNFLRLTIPNASGLDKLPILVSGNIEKEDVNEAVQVFTIKSGLFDSYSKTIKVKSDEVPILEAKIVIPLSQSNSVQSISSNEGTIETMGNPANSNASPSSPTMLPNSTDYFTASASEVEMIRVALLDSSENVHSVIFDNPRNRIIYSAIEYGTNFIIVKDLKTLEELHRFAGKRVKAISPDGNRIFYDRNIIDLREGQVYELDVFFPTVPYKTSVAWIEQDKIIAYQNVVKDGQVRPLPSKYEYLDLQDLQIRKIPEQECYNLASSLQASNNSYHLNLFVSIGSDVRIYDQNSPYNKTLIPYSSKPINGGWCSNNFEYFIIDHSVVNQVSKIVLYRLFYTGTKKGGLLTSVNPYEHFSDSFKKEFDKLGMQKIYATVYEPKVNPLNDALVGPDRYKHIGEVNVTGINQDGSLSYQMSRDDYGKEIESGHIVSNFRVSQYNTDNAGAWAVIKSGGGDNGEGIDLESGESSCIVKKFEVRGDDIYVTVDYTEFIGYDDYTSAAIHENFDTRLRTFRITKQSSIMIFDDNLRKAYANLWPIDSELLNMLKDYKMWDISVKNGYVVNLNQVYYP